MPPASPRGVACRVCSSPSSCGIELRHICLPWGLGDGGGDSSHSPRWGSWRGRGECDEGTGPRGLGREGCSCRPTSGKWEASGLLHTGRCFPARRGRAKAQKAKVAQILIIFLLECYDYKNKTCFL